MSYGVREPIQVYLSAEERSRLDAVAAGMGISRSEALRRGVDALATMRSAAALSTLAARGLVVPATPPDDLAPPVPPPVASLESLLDELEADRSDR